MNIKSCEENYGQVDEFLMNAKVRGTCFTQICEFKYKKFATGLNAGSENFIETIRFGHGI